MKGFGIKLLILAMIFAGLAAFVGYTALSRATDNVVEGPVQEYLVASQLIEAGTKITSDMVKGVERPVGAADENIVVKREEIVGKYASSDILQNEYFRSERLVEEDTSRIIYTLQEGFRTVTLSVDPYSAAADLIVPGDRVDLAVYLPEKKDNGRIIRQDLASLFLADVEVLAVDRISKRGTVAHEEVPEQFAITLAVPVMATEQVVLAEHIGFVELMLRPIHDHNTPTTPNAIWKDLQHRFE